MPALWRSDRTLFATLVTLVAVNSSYGLFYTIAEDKDAYYLPSLIAIALFAGFGLRAPRRRRAPRRLARRRRAAPCPWRRCSRAGRRTTAATNMSRRGSSTIRSPA
ncbi:MAG: hypothetical protein R2862_11660 [Thermoanaerobaculia bacterium]